MWHLFDDDHLKNDILPKLKKLVRVNSITEHVVPKMIFLCGKQILDANGEMPKDEALENGNNKRHFVYKDLVNRKILGDDREEYNVFIPIISERLYIGKDKYLVDLLTFEEILADISHSILLILESSGTICELGAFALNNDLAKKICIINDIVFEKELSFITQGPVRKIFELNENVIYLDKMESRDRDFLTDFRLSRYIEELQNLDATFQPNKNSKSLHIRDFIYELLSIIWYFGPVTEDELRALYKEIKFVRGFDFSNKYNQKFKTISDMCDFLIKIKLLVSYENTPRFITLNPSYNFAWHKLLFKVKDQKEDV